MHLIVFQHKEAIGILKNGSQRSPCSVFKLLYLHLKRTADTVGNQEVTEGKKMPQKPAVWSQTQAIHPPKNCFFSGLESKSQFDTSWYKKPQKQKTIYAFSRTLIVFHGLPQ